MNVPSPVGILEEPVLTELEKARKVVESMTPLQRKKLEAYINTANNKAKKEANKKSKRRKANKTAQASKKKNR